MPDSRRLLRLEQAILETVGPLVAHGLADPRLSMVTVTRVKLSPDLSIARVHWSCLGSEADRTKASRALAHARGHMQRAVAKSLRTRTTPHLVFHFDTAVEGADKIDRLLQQIARERESRPAPPPAPQGGSGESAPPPAPPQ